MGRFGIWEILIIVGVALLLFGAGRIADIGKGLGEGIRNFKKGIREDEPSPKQLGKGEGDKPEIIDAPAEAPAKQLAESKAAAPADEKA